MDVAQARCARRGAATLEFDLAGRDVSSSSCTTRISSGAILKNRASAAADLPRFMNVWGSKKQPTVLPCTVARAASPQYAFGLQMHLEFARQRVNPPESGVVAGCFVLGPRAAQADKQFDSCRRLSGDEVANGPRRWAVGRGSLRDRLARADYFLPLPLLLAGAAAAASAAGASISTAGGTTATRVGLFCEPRVTALTPWAA